MRWEAKLKNKRVASPNNVPIHLKFLSIMIINKISLITLKTNGLTPILSQSYVFEICRHFSAIEKQVRNKDPFS